MLLRNTKSAFYTTTPEQAIRLNGNGNSKNRILIPIYVSKEMELYVDSIM